MGVVESPLEDGVPDGGVADDVVPVVDRDLAGEQRAAAGVAIVKDLEEVVASVLPHHSAGKPTTGEDRAGYDGRVSGNNPRSSR